MYLTRSLALAGASGLAALAVGLTPGIASAAGSGELQSSCTAGGFTGTIQFQYQWTVASSRPTKVLSVLYEINKGGNRGGNSANVNWADGGANPSKLFGTGSGIQDGRFHALFTGPAYSRANGPITTRFVFDKSLAADPSCTVNFGSR